MTRVCGHYSCSCKIGKVMQRKANNIYAVLTLSVMQITIDNCVEVEHIATDLLLEDVQLNISECYETHLRAQSQKYNLSSDPQQSLKTVYPSITTLFTPTDLCIIIMFLVQKLK